MNHYQLLGIAKDATAEEIKAAFRHKAATLHPDRFAMTVESADASDERNRRFAELKVARETLADPRRRHEYDKAIRVPQGLRDLLSTRQGERAMARLLPRAPKQARNGEDRVVVVRVPAATLAAGGAIEPVPGIPEELDPVLIPSGASKARWGRLPGRGEPGENDGEPGDLYVVLRPSDR